MNILLIFFALPIATIIFSIVLQKLLKCPILVAITIFAIFLIVTFAVFSAEFLVFAILYAILAFITAFVTMIICEYLENRRGLNCDKSFNGIITISSENGVNADNNNCGCNNNSNNNDFVARANIVPNSNGRSGSFNGCYRRR